MFQKRMWNEPDTTCQLGIGLSGQAPVELETRAWSVRL